jgi:hypothetical protein
MKQGTLTIIDSVISLAQGLPGVVFWDAFTGRSGKQVTWTLLVWVTGNMLLRERII